MKESPTSDSATIDSFSLGATIYTIRLYPRGYGGIIISIIFIPWFCDVQDSLTGLLSCKGFLPLGRLTYCVYLIHYDYLNVFYSAVRKQFYYTMFEQFTSICFGVLVISFGLAFVAAVTVEAAFPEFREAYLCF